MSGNGFLRLMHRETVGTDDHLLQSDTVQAGRFVLVRTRSCALHWIVDPGRLRKYS